MTLVSSQGLRPAKSNENVVMAGLLKVRLGSRAFGASGSFVQAGQLDVSLFQQSLQLVTDLLGLSARRMLKALADGETNPAAVAALADGRLRAPRNSCATRSVPVRS